MNGFLYGEDNIDSNYNELDSCLGLGMFHPEDDIVKGDLSNVKFFSRNGTADCTDSILNPVQSDSSLNSFEIDESEVKEVFKGIKPGSPSISEIKIEEKIINSTNFNLTIPPSTKNPSSFCGKIKPKNKTVINLTGKKRGRAKKEESTSDEGSEGDGPFTVENNSKKTKRHDNTVSDNIQRKTETDFRKSVFNFLKSLCIKENIKSKFVPFQQIKLLSFTQTSLQDYIKKQNKRYDKTTAKDSNSETFKLLLEKLRDKNDFLFQLFTKNSLMDFFRYYYEQSHLLTHQGIFMKGFDDFLKDKNEKYRNKAKVVIRDSFKNKSA